MSVKPANELLMQNTKLNLNYSSLKYTTHNMLGALCLVAKKKKKSQFVDVSEMRDVCSCLSMSVFERVVYALMFTEIHC